MRERTYQIAIVLAAIALALAVIFTGSAQAKQEVCPEEGKVESVVDGDLDGIVLDAGTLVCIKGGRDVVTVTADGEATLAELFGNNKNVSHYTILEEPSDTTTTSTTPTTTTTSSPTSTTSLPPSASSTTVTSTSVPPPPATTTSAPTESTTTEPEFGTVYVSAWCDLIVVTNNSDESVEVGHFGVIEGTHIVLPGESITLGGNPGVAWFVKFRAGDWPENRIAQGEYETCETSTTTTEPESDSTTTTVTSETTPPSSGTTPTTQVSESVPPSDTPTSGGMDDGPDTEELPYGGIDEMLMAYGPSTALLLILVGASLVVLARRKVAEGA